MRRIQAKKHELGTYEIDKKSLSVFDAKRSTSKDGIHTRAYLQKDLKKSSHKKEKILTFKKDLKRFS